MKAIAGGRRCLATLLLCSLLPLAWAFVPAHDDVVLEVLPTRLNSELRQIDALQRQAATRPANAEAAVTVARRYVETSRQLGDPRFLGYAEAALAPWRQGPHMAPVEVLVMQAVVLQAQHRFDEAVPLLERALQQDPHHPQAWLTLSSIRQVQGDRVAARKACLPLGSYDAGVAADCVAGVDAQGPQAERAYAMLRRRHAEPTLPDWQRAWLTLTLAETAARLGRNEEAARWYRLARPETGNTYLKAAYADFLLDRGQSEAVVRLLTPHTAADPLLLRLAEASQRLRAPQTAHYLSLLEQRFAALRARADDSHLREEARFHLLRGHADIALTLAERNWRTQKEEADVRLLLEAALAARQPGRAQSALAWLRQQGWKNVALQALARKLETRS